MLALNSFIGKYSPWGKIDGEHPVTDGICFVGTPGHGGFKLDRKHNAMIPSVFRRNGGWYEEDCEAAIVLIFLREHFTQEEYDNGIKTLKNYFWREYEFHFQQTLAEGESYSKDSHNFYRKHAEDWVGIAARGDWHPDVPKGFVGVSAKQAKFVVLNGDNTRAYSAAAERRFLVPADEYDKRGNFSFVIDLLRHQEVDFKF